MECERQPTCSFFSEFKDDLDRKQYQLFVRSYCLGNLKNFCKRLAYERDHGRPAPDNLCPNGFRYRSFRNR
jgi:hypothetical protein